MKQEKIYPIRRVPVKYKPSPEALAFHRSQARFRTLCWGVKSGKSHCGAQEFARSCAAQPRKLSWLVSPTFFNLQAAEWNLVNSLYDIEGLVAKNGYNRHSHDIQLSHGGVIQCRSADQPNNLRGPNLDGALWLDEAAYLKEEAWYILRGRVAATDAEIMATTTPDGRNWFYNECQKSGMSADAPYGVFESGDYFVSHFPTSQFPWVPKKELEDIRQSMPALLYAQDFEASFVCGGMEAFTHIEESFTLELPKAIQAHYVIGYDPGQKQDPAGVVVLRAEDGLVVGVEKWRMMEWELQITKIAALAVKWGNATVIFDRANVGSVLEGLLRNAGVTIKPIDLNSPMIKNEIIMGLQMAFEQGRIKLPDYRAAWAPPYMKDLYNELKWYEPKITPGGKIAYSAPKGLTDDLVIALALSNFGRMSGAGSNAAISVVYGMDGTELEDADIQGEEYEYKPIFKTKAQREAEESEIATRLVKDVDKKMKSMLHSKRPNVGKHIYGKRAVPGLNGGNYMWR